MGLSDLHHLYRQSVMVSHSELQFPHQTGESLKYEKKHIEDLEALNQSKLRFFTNISHEFRTPLTLIVGQVETLLQVQTFTPNIYHKILGIYKNSLQLRELITELLDFRKQEQGHMKIKVSPPTS